MRRIISIFFFLFIAIPFFAQKNWNIESINFEGLEKTSENYIRQFLTSKEGHAFSNTELQNDVQQLWNIGIHQNVTTKIDSLPDQKIKITFQLVEKKTLLPILNFGGIKSNIWFQIGAVDFNFRGKGHQFLAYYQNTDLRHGGQIYYRIPYLNQNWGIAFDLLQWRSEEPLFFSEGTVYYNYDNLNLGITGIRNFGFRKRVELTSSLFQEKYFKNDNQTLIDPPGPSELSVFKLSSKVEYIENLLNYNDFYISGWSWRSIWQTVFNFEDSSFFNSLIFQIRKFSYFGKKGNLAARFRFGISTNNDSPFAPFVVDSRVNLRGSGNRIERGTGQLILNLEYRHTVLNFDNWAMQANLFSDLGNWRSPGGKINQFFDTQELRHFVGGGFRIIYKRIYNAIVRVDYGVDIYNSSQRGFVLGIGQYF